MVLLSLQFCWRKTPHTHFRQRRRPLSPEEPQYYRAACGELLAEPQTRVAEDDCRVQGEGDEGEIRMDFFQLSKLLLPIIVLRLACLTCATEGANAEN
jgi:hypothetical protein